MVFARGRWASAAAAVMTLVAMLQYPGGTLLDHSTQRYSLTQNFLSDLGMTVAHNERPNALGAMLFVLSLLTAVVGAAGCLVGFIRLYSTSRHAQRLARGAGIAGVLTCAAFIGVALAPENRLLDLHVQLTLLAFRIFPLVAILLLLASRANVDVPRGVVIGWAVLSIVLVAYVIDLGWGPSLDTVQGLTVQVVAQKIVAVTAMLVIVYQTVEADRLRVARGQTMS